MRRILTLLMFATVACKTAAPPPPPTFVPPVIHGLTAEEEAKILRMEDRREYGPAVASEWSQNENALHRSRIALALGRIGPLTFADTNGNGERDANEHQAGVAELTKMSDDK